MADPCEFGSDFAALPKRRHADGGVEQRGHGGRESEVGSRERGRIDVQDGLNGRGTGLRVLNIQGQNHAADVIGAARNADERNPRIADFVKVQSL